MQLDIFNTSQNKRQDLIDLSVPGVKYVPNFITENEERSLLQIIDSEPWITDLKRRVQHYGWRYNYKSRSIDYSMYLGELPNWLSRIADRLEKEKIIPKIPDQVIINEYEPGQGIAQHVDCAPCFEDSISSLSIGSPCIMELYRLSDNKKEAVFLENRSLIRLSSEARYSWSHGIPARRSDLFEDVKHTRTRRISLTFRNVIIPSEKNSLLRDTLTIYHSFLADPADAFDRADVIGILGDQVARVFRFNLTKGILHFFFPLHGDYLGLCKDQAVLVYKGFQCLQPFVEDLQTVPLPDTANAGR